MFESGLDLRARWDGSMRMGVGWGVASAGDWGLRMLGVIQRLFKRIKHRGLWSAAGRLPQPGRQVRGSDKDQLLAALALLQEAPFREA